ncbi:MAG: CHAT domain-containing tetratricopeptide repeat protein, partial [Bacteroidota bacterium]
RELGKVYNTIGDFYQSLDSYDKLIALTKGVVGQEEKLLQAYYRRAQTYMAMEPTKHNQQIKIDLQKADSVRQIIGAKAAKYRLDIVVTEGNRLMQNAAYGSAVQHYERATGIIDPSKKRNLSMLYSNLGIAYIATKQYKEAKASIERSLQLRPDFSSNYENFGAYYLATGNYDLAIDYFEKAVSLHIGGTIETPTKLTTAALNKADSPYDLLQTLAFIGSTYLAIYKENKQESLLQKAISTYEIADQLIDEIRFSSYEVKSKLYWREQSADLYLQAVKTCYLLQKPALAYYFMEKNKAILLLEDISENEAIDRAAIPQEIVFRETAYKRAILNTEQMIAKTERVDLLDTLRDERYLLKIRHQQFLDSIGEAFPVFRQLKKRLSVMSASNFQQYLTQSKAHVIHYIVGDDEGFGLYSHSDQMMLFEIKDLNSLRKEVNQLRTGSGTVLATKEAVGAYQALANSIGQKILPPTLMETEESLRSLLIIPDYYLQLVSFETLIQDTHYLIENFEISYAYSISHLTENAQRDRNAKDKFIGFAPESFPNRDLATLPDSRREIEDLQDITGGKKLLGNAATKTKFMEICDQYDILHLSTHADAGSADQPWIALSDGNIYLPELYTTTNQAEMVVLSACNTSLGALEKGEGIMSLARGFTNAGANSVVSSLWPTNDLANKELMLDFYKELSRGEDKATALRTAKLNYLRSHTGTEASPFYWGSLILVGNSDAIESISSGGPVWFLFLIPLLLIPLAMVVRKKIVAKG